MARSNRWRVDKGLLELATEVTNRLIAVVNMLLDLCLGCLTPSLALLDLALVLSLGCLTPSLALLDLALTFLELALEMFLGCLTPSLAFLNASQKQRCVFFDPNLKPRLSSSRRAAFKLLTRFNDRRR